MWGQTESELLPKPELVVFYPVESDEAFRFADLFDSLAWPLVVEDFDLRLHLQTLFDDVDGQPKDAGEKLSHEARHEVVESWVVLKDLNQQYFTW